MICAEAEKPHRSWSFAGFFLNLLLRVLNILYIPGFSI